jgi:hypothetical protein
MVAADGEVIVEVEEGHICTIDPYLVAEVHFASYGGRRRWVEGRDSEGYAIRVCLYSKIERRERK